MTGSQELIQKLHESIYRYKLAKEDVRKEYDLGDRSLSQLNAKLAELDKLIIDAQVELNSILSEEKLINISVETWDVFISYQHLSDNEASEIYKHLTNAGLRVWQDVNDIRHSNRWSVAINEALRNARRLILLLTPEAMSSEEVFNEWFYFYTQHKPIHCLLLKECEVHYQLLPYQYLDWRIADNRDWRLLLRGLRENSTQPQVDGVSNKSDLQRQSESNTFDIFGRNLVTRTKTRLLNSPIVPWIASQSPSLDFIWPKLFVDPVISPKKHPLGEMRLSDWKKAQWQADRSFALIGTAGIGKSTALISFYLTQSEQYLSHATNVVPIFVRAMELTYSNTDSIDLFINYAAADLGLDTIEGLDHKPSYLVFIDGIDEVDIKSLLPILQVFLINSLREHNFIIACRSDYFEDHISPKVGLNQLFYETLELISWSKQLSLKFARDYLEECQKHELYTTLLEAVESETVSTFLSRPFQLTLILYLLTVRDRLLPGEIANMYALYKTFYTSWTRREVARGSSKLNQEALAIAHQRLAFELYTQKGISIPIDDIAKVIGIAEEDIGLYTKIRHSCLYWRSEARRFFTRMISLDLYTRL